MRFFEISPCQIINRLAHVSPPFMKISEETKGSGEGNLSQAFESFVGSRLMGLEAACKGAQVRHWDMIGDGFTRPATGVGRPPA